MLPLYAFSGGRHRLCVDCGQSRTAALDPQKTLARLTLRLVLRSYQYPKLAAVSG